MVVWPELSFPYAALLLPLAALPWWGSPLRRKACAWVELVPSDRLACLIAWALPVVGSLTLGALILALTRPSLPEQRVLRLGRGAQLVLVLDRSSSMDEGFIGGAGSESKGRVAARLLKEFLAQRPYDLIGVVAFSSAALVQCPLTVNRTANQAAVATVGHPALAYTHVAKGLAQALDLFEDRNLGARAVVLVSDGAAVIEPKIQHLLRVAFQRKRASLYWIYLRSQGSPGLNEPPKEPALDNPHARPEYYLNRYFQSLGIPYQAFEAEDPKALAKALSVIDALEQKPFFYFKTRPRRELAEPLLAAAALGVLVLLLIKVLER
nr:hypothetical conserved protein [uncultured Gammaproteobacteria bacterium]